MKCPHCEQHLVLLYPGDVTFEDKWVCRNHKHSISMHSWSDGSVLQPPHPTIYEFAYAFNYKNRSYGIYWQTDSNDRQISWELFTNSGKVPRENLIKLSFIPAHITPDNIDDKIATLLTFL